MSTCWTNITCSALSFQESLLIANTFAESFPSENENNSTLSQRHFLEDMKKPCFLVQQQKLACPTIWVHVSPALPALHPNPAKEGPGYQTHIIEVLGVLHDVGSPLILFNLHPSLPKKLPANEKCYGQLSTTLEWFFAFYYSFTWNKLGMNLPGVLEAGEAGLEKTGGQDSSLQATEELCVHVSACTHMWVGHVWYSSCRGKPGCRVPTTVRFLTYFLDRCNKGRSWRRGREEARYSLVGNCFED